jgi:hypothetical protein
MMDAQNDLAEPGIGHNLGFISLDADGRVVLDANIMREYLGEEIAGLAARKAELLGSVARAPATISDEETAGKIADLTKLIAACIKNAEADRVARKESFLEGGRVIDGVFRGITEPLIRGKADIERRLTLYQREVAEIERRRREFFAQVERAEADRLAREAAEREAAAQTEANIDEAISADALAQQRQADAVAAQKAAEANPAELSRQRSDFGAVASLRRFWDAEGIDRDTLDLETLRPHLPLDALEKAVRSFIRAGGRELRGVRIFENTATTVR